MSCVSFDPLADRDAGELPSGDEGIRGQVWGLLAAMDPRGHSLERRRNHRYPYPYLIYLTPVTKDGQSPAGESVVVVGKHLSEQGLGFYHPRPLPFRRVIATLETAAGVRIGFLMDLAWCRFTREGWYESGGRFRGVVPSPITVGEE